MKTPIAALLLSVITAYGAMACSCMPVDPEELIAKSSAAFSGRVLSVKRTEEDINRGEVIARVRILRAIKGVRKGRIVTVTTGPNSAMCGVEFTKGGTIKVAAQKTARGRYRTGLCSTL